MKDSTLVDKKLSAISILVLIGLWALVSKIIDKEVILPTVASTLSSLISIVKEPEFINIIISSVLRSLIGFLISLFLAILLGILSSLSKLIYNCMIPVLSFLSSVPTMAIIILALIWFNNDIVPMFVGFLMVFPILYENVVNSILNVDRHIIEMAKTYDVDKISIIKDIYMPSVFIGLDQVFISSLSTTLKMVVAGEALSQPRYAVGSSLQIEKMLLNTSGVFAWIIIILVISKLLVFLTKGLRSIYDTRRWN